jgi:hypothetical protein
MKRQLIQFNGGLQTKLDEHFCPPNQATACKNINLSKGSIFPYFGLEDNGTIDGKYIYFLSDGTIVSNTDEADIRSYVFFGNRLYWSNGTFNSFGLTRYDGTSTGIEATAPDAPDGTLSGATVSGINVLSNTYTYCYTYVDADGVESQPSQYLEISPSGQDVQLTISAETNTPLDISKRKIYRVGGTNPTFNLIAELDDPTLTYTDSTRDIDVSRIELYNREAESAPSDLTNLIENNGTFYGSVGDRVYFSIQGQPEYWSSLDFVELSDECTGIGKYGEQVLAFTKASTYLITGFNRNNIAVRELPYKEGCVNSDSIANVGESLLWASYNGICIYDGSQVTVLTRNILSWNKTTEIGDAKFGDFGEAAFNDNYGYKIGKAIGIDGHYYALFQGGILDIDVLNRATSSTIYIEDTFSLYYDTTTDKLNIAYGESAPYTVKSFDSDTSTNMLGLWQTGEIIGEEGYNPKKQYRKIYFDDIVQSTTVAVDGKTFTIDNKKEFFLPSGYIGNSIKVTITTDRPIRSMTIEYGLLK